MVEVEIDSIRISLISQHRIVMLRDIDGDRQLPIWIGPCEAEAITFELQDTEVARPLTHDLLKNAIEAMSGKVSHILINELRDQVFYARLYIDVDGTLLDVDCRPSDAIALAVRARTPIFIDEQIMGEVGILPEPDINEIESTLDLDDPPAATSESTEKPSAKTKETDETEGEATSPDAFSDFLNTLDFGDFDE